MIALELLTFLAVYLSVLSGVLSVGREGHSWGQRFFAAGMMVFAAEALTRVLGSGAPLPEDILRWERARLLAIGLAPGTWLLFSLTYARTNHAEFLRRWRWVVGAAFGGPLVLAAAFSTNLLSVVVAPDGSRGPVVRLGWSGAAVYVFVLLTAILILTNFEWTLRGSTGRIRWQIKFTLLGVALLFAVQIYTSSQALLYMSINRGLGTVQDAGLIAANLLFLGSLLRSRLRNIDFYLSRATIQGSLTIVIVGVYLLIVGALAHVVKALNRSTSLALDALVVLFALTVLAMLLVSDRLRLRLKLFVTRHFSRPHYDYRKEWISVTSRTASIVDVQELCGAVAKLVSEALDVLSVNIWLCEDAPPRLALAGSTVFTRRDAKDLERASKGLPELLAALPDRQTAIDFAVAGLDWPGEIMRLKPYAFGKYRMRYGIPLSSGGELVGLMTVNDDRVGGQAFSTEDLDLLQTFGLQIATSVLNLRLSERLRHARETEAFQKVSAFFVHDLKNLASRLSLTMQNLPVHYDNAEFREDALRGIAASLDKINAMCGRLSVLKENIEIAATETDLRELVNETLDELASGLKVAVERDLQPTPKVQLDRQQIEKVLTNLVLNANDAVNGNGKIRISTTQSNGAVAFSVSDNGCGMSEAFIEHSLFRPFQTTKKQGLGIGLFHCKLIVEAHGGDIDVESEVGKGTLFRIVLPMQQKTLAAIQTDQG
jgi:putative PEP-CTERM system histidine kinase